MEILSHPSRGCPKGAFSRSFFPPIHFLSLSLSHFLSFSFILSIILSISFFLNLFQSLSFFLSFSSFSHSDLSTLAKQCNLQPRQVERWFRYRLNQDRPSLTKKFCETSNSSPFLLFPLCVLQPLQTSLLGYYLVQLSFYCSLLISLPFDVKRMDLHEQIIHHLVTIFLIGFSFCLNFIRIGSLVMFLHDISDCLLEVAKMFTYLKWQKTCDALFVTFSVAFLVTRLGIFPCKILHNTYYYSMEIYQPFFGYYFFNALLMVLQLLHIFWSYLIIRMVYRFLICGMVRAEMGHLGEGVHVGEKGEDRKLLTLHRKRQLHQEGNHFLPNIYLACRKKNPT
uniref:TLC domain-containing protein n=1 Tax=Pseudonaja textilis TaxID=8673 RepID=A0A670ZLN4_PSETE